MEENVKQFDIKFSILKTKCLSFKLTDYAKSNSEVIPFENFEFELKFQIDLMETEKIFNVNIWAKIIAKTTGGEKYEISELASLTSYSIINFDSIDWKKNNEGKILIPNLLVVNCLNIAISATRGMYSVKLEDTNYSIATLPLVDSNLLIPPNPGK